jgi:hypothetical protein
MIQSIKALLLVLLTTSIKSKNFNFQDDKGREWLLTSQDDGLFASVSFVLGQWRFECIETFHFVDQLTNTNMSIGIFNKAVVKLLTKKLREDGFDYLEYKRYDFHRCRDEDMKTKVLEGSDSFGFSEPVKVRVENGEVITFRKVDNSLSISLILEIRGFGFRSTNILKVTSNYLPQTFVLIVKESELIRLRHFLDINNLKDLILSYED